MLCPSGLQFMKGWGATSNFSIAIFQLFLGTPCRYRFQFFSCFWVPLAGTGRYQPVPFLNIWDPLPTKFVGTVKFFTSPSLFLSYIHIPFFSFNLLNIFSFSSIPLFTPKLSILLSSTFPPTHHSITYLLTSTSISS